ncbi:TetR family transcriptional regulator [Microbacterium sp. 4R-513]|uniref:TetR/AcrR family transcriptional regulator n=1 Tax=Microbacterium sp. 4R-513 TaxID=2567934 RepID=UPI0013E0EC71|nr:TetR family transcriptional regulator C-terminal domain-containing protein [Microbacterium sp. 4R-513]QIG39617.1 TetR family transcriptional regulator [Microbacterium sp. 4R-513]
MSSTARKKAARKSAAERSAEIAEAARDLALAEGLSAVSLRAVAARIDVAPALVAHYEPNMDALVAASFRTVVSPELDEMRRVIAAAPTATVALAGLLATLLDGTRDDVTVVWVEAWAMGRRNETLAAAVRAEMDAWQAVVKGVVDEGVRTGEFETDASATADVAWQILGMIDGLNAQALVRWNDERARGSALHRAIEGMLGLDRLALDRP